MNTFLPYKSFKKSAQCLDNKRLGKQRVEVLQILKALNGESKGWVSHPCTKMWKGHERDLIFYGIAICEEWISRGYKDTCLEKIKEYYWYCDCILIKCPPSFLGQKKFHDAYKSNLLRKDPIFYGKYNWKVPDNLEYTWGK